MTTTTIDEIIKKYRIVEYFDSSDSRKLKMCRKPTDEDELAFVHTHKAEILAKIDEIKAAEEEDRKHRHEIIICGWEASTVYVDDRKDIEAEIDSIYKHHGNWTGCSREDIAEQVRGKLAKKQQEEERKEAREVERQKEEQMKKEERATFEVVKTHEVQQAWGDEENGADGFADVIIRRVADGEVIRVIERNVFDFGHYGYPRSSAGTDAALDRQNWTELEREAVAWIEKFGPLKNKQMRM